MPASATTPTTWPLPATLWSRAPSRVRRSAARLRIFSARWRGVWERGLSTLDCRLWTSSEAGAVEESKRRRVEGAEGSWRGRSTFPHSRQNFAPAGSSVAQLLQRSANACPHSRQNLAVSGFSCPQLAQFTLAPYPSRQPSTAAAMTSWNRSAFQYCSVFASFIRSVTSKYAATSSSAGSTQVKVPP